MTISDWETGETILEVEAESIKAALEEAIARDPDAVFTRADLEDEDLSAANLSGAHLHNASLQGADLNDADLRNANLRSADLRSADLCNANLRSADLSGAHLYGADLRGADLRGARLTRAILADANLRGAVLGDTKFDVERLDGADLTPIRDDFWAVLSAAPSQAEGLRRALDDGRVNRSLYEDGCSCLAGTRTHEADAGHDQADVLASNAARPIACFFRCIEWRDYPGNSQFSRLALQWLDEWLTNIKAEFWWEPTMYSELEQYPELLSYHGKREIKDAFLARVRGIKNGGEFAIGWQNNADSNAIERFGYEDYETEIGIPRQLAVIANNLHLVVPDDRKAEWAVTLFEAIPIGVNLYPAYWKFLNWLLIDPVDGVRRFANSERMRGAIDRVAILNRRRIAGGIIGLDLWRAAWSEATCAMEEAKAEYELEAYPLDDETYLLGFSDADSTAASADFAVSVAAVIADDAINPEKLSITVVTTHAASAAARVAPDPIDTAHRSQIRQGEKLLELLRAAR